VRGKPGQFGIGTGCGEDLGVAGSDHPSPLSFERARDNRGATRLPTTAYELVNELDQVIGESYSDLLAHPNTVPHWDGLTVVSLLIPPRDAATDPHSRAVSVKRRHEHLTRHPVGLALRGLGCVRRSSRRPASDLADGLTGEVDVLPRMWGPVFDQARTPEGFVKVAVDEETGTIAWPGDTDLAPDTLYKRVRTGL
jgi:hypothetical protein